MFTKKDLKNHKKSARLLLKIKDKLFIYLQKNKDVSEDEAQQFILNKFREFGIDSDKDPPIVAFGKNTSIVHYFPAKDSNIIKENDLILVDIWGNLKSTKSLFSDITWMAYNGKKIPREIQKIWDIIKKIRGEIIEDLENNLKENVIPTGQELNQITKDVMAKHGFLKQPHSTGHSIGFEGPHGDLGGINSTNNNPLEKNVCYTIEPGLYIKNKFGLRTEIDFYIDDKNKLVLTTDLQNEIILL